MSSSSNCSFHPRHWSTCVPSLAEEDRWRSPSPESDRETEQIPDVVLKLHPASLCSFTGKGFPKSCEEKSDGHQPCDLLAPYCGFRQEVITDVKELVSMETSLPLGRFPSTCAPSLLSTKLEGECSLTLTGSPSLCVCFSARNIQLCTLSPNPGRLTAKHPRGTWDANRTSTWHFVF